MADSLINGLTETDNVQDDDLFVVWKNGISQTRSVKKSNLGIRSGGGGKNPYRPIIFGFNRSNKKHLLFKAGTSYSFSYQNVEYVTSWNVDTPVDVSAMMTTAASVASTRQGQENGRVFNIFITTDREIVLSTRLDAPSDVNSEYSELNTKWIGCFGTLCANVGSNLNGLIPLARNSLAIGDGITVKSRYRKNDPYGFHDFYTKNLSSISTGSYYDVGTVPHTLAGFNAGDILPESVFSLDFYPMAFDSGNTNVMGMVYDIDTNKAIDIYLQSGTGQNTGTVYGSTHTVSRQQQNHEDDMRCVGKQLLSDDEFASSALGSNERTSIQGASDQTTVGGHNDTNGNRMISFIGCEEMCGYLWQWLRDVSCNGGSGWSNYDGQGSLGQTYGASYALLAGGAWGNGSSCGSRCRLGFNPRSSADFNFGGRGVSQIFTN